MRLWPIDTVQVGVYVELESNFSRGKNGIEEMLFFGKIGEKH